MPPVITCAHSRKRNVVHFVRTPSSYVFLSVALAYFCSAAAVSTEGKPATAVATVRTRTFAYVYLHMPLYMLQLARKRLPCLIQCSLASIFSSVTRCNSLRPEAKRTILHV